MQIWIKPHTYIIMSQSMNRWSNGVGPFPLGPSNDVLLVFNFGRKTVRDYNVSGLPYNGNWTARFNGDSLRYSPLFAGECVHQTYIEVEQLRSVICIPALTMLVLTRDDSSVGSTQ